MEEQNQKAKIENGLFKTRFTELLGIQYPIQCGTMMYINDADFVAAGANAGIFSCLASAMFSNEKELSDEIKKLKDLTDRPFGVNVSLFPGLLPMPVERYLDVVAKRGGQVIETAGRSPEPYLKMIRDRGFLHIHKCARLRDAVKSASMGVDAVSLVGTECGGHPSMEDVTSLILVPEAAGLISVPLIAGGGFCDGRTLVAAIAMGADAAVMGTRFINTEECRIHPSIKERFLQARETDTVVIQKSIGSATRVFKNDWAIKVLEMEREGISLEDLLPFISGKRTANAWRGGDEKAIFSCGQVVGRTKENLTIRDLVEKIIAEAENVIARISGS